MTGFVHTASYKARVKGATRADRRAFEDTVRLYRAAVAFLVDVADRHWGEIAGAGGANARSMALERIAHSTSKRAAAEPGFDAAFPKFPSYLRRAAQSAAVGAVSAFRSNLARWEAGGRKGGRPRLGRLPLCFPAFFKGNMFEWDGRSTSCRVKAFVGGDWRWVDVRLSASDVRYFERHCAGASVSSPVLERAGKRWALRFTFERKVELSDEPRESMRACAVDLGIGAGAAMCVVEPDGTVVARRVLNLAAEEDRLARALGRVRKAQSHGARRTPRLWAVANSLNKAISRRIAREAVDFAALHSCHVLVFERLETGGRKKVARSARQRVHLWRAREVQRCAESQAHLLGMRVSRVNAANTSRLAFDGSGAVYRGPRALDQAVADGVITEEERGSFNKRRKGREVASWRTCLFPTGKRYDADLNASYNIAARFHVRERLKSLTESERLAVQAKVPGCAKRTTCTLSSLIDLGIALAA